MNVDFRSIAGGVASVAWVAAKSFVGTLMLFMILGAIYAGASGYVLFEYRWYYAVIAVVIVLAEAIALGVFLGIKRATVMAAAHGLGKLRLGAAAVRIIFGKILGIDEGKEMGNLASTLSSGLDRIPLAQAQDLVTNAVVQASGEPGQGGWLRRTIQSRLLKTVGKYTLARFRTEGAEKGSIDLYKVKEELEQTVDDVLVQKVRGGLRFWIWLGILGLPIVVALETWLAVWLIDRYS